MYLLFLRTISVHSCSSVSCSYKPYFPLRIPLCFSSFTKMNPENRNRGWYSKRRGSSHNTTNRHESDIKNKDAKNFQVHGDRSTHNRSPESGDAKKTWVPKDHGDRSTHNRRPESGESLPGSIKRSSKNHESSLSLGSPYGDGPTHTRSSEAGESVSESIKRSSNNHESPPPVGSPCQVGVPRHSSSGRNFRPSPIERSHHGQISTEKEVSSKRRESESLLVNDSNAYDKEWPELSSYSSSIDRSSNIRTPQNVQKLEEREDESSIIYGGFVNSSDAFSGRKERPSQAGILKDRQSPEKAVSQRSSEQSEVSAMVTPFDICQSKIGTPYKLKTPLHVKNRERRKELEHSKEALTPQRLRPGMILLKKHITQHDQIMIIKKCRVLGRGPGGFYQPGYQDGGKLHLQMMCLGKNWDPETREYKDHRPTDGAKPPIIPTEFKQLVESSIKASHAHIKQVLPGKNAEDELPWMSPDICIINFYNNSGKLGLHQDRDESQDSLRKGRPVVSFSIGDSAEFLFGVRREDEPEKIVLESGDVLIFGGESRHVFHGVPSILPSSAPSFLTEEAELRPGRLNLTFRQY